MVLRVARHFRAIEYTIALRRTLGIRNIKHPNPSIVLKSSFGLTITSSQNKRMFPVVAVAHHSNNAPYQLFEVDRQHSTLARPNAIKETITTQTTFSSREKTFNEPGVEMVATYRRTPATTIQNRLTELTRRRRIVSTDNIPKATWLRIHNVLKKELWYLGTPNRSAPEC